VGQEMDRVGQEIGRIDPAEVEAVEAVEEPAR
jgi:hypothetical protein